MILQILGVLFLAGVLAEVAARSPRRRECRALTNVEREHFYKQRLDNGAGLWSEEQIARAARGAVTRTWILAGIRRDIPTNRALVPTGQPVRVRYTGPMPKGRKNVRQFSLPLRRPRTAANPSCAASQR